MTAIHSLNCSWQHYASICCNMSYKRTVWLAAEKCRWKLFEKPESAEPPPTIQCDYEPTPSVQILVNIKALNRDAKRISDTSRTKIVFLCNVSSSGGITSERWVHVICQIRVGVLILVPKNELKKKKNVGLKIRAGWDSSVWK